MALYNQDLVRIVYGTAGATKFMRIIEEECNSSGSSSISKNSDDDNEDQEGDAQSPYRYDHQNNNKISNRSLDDAVQALEEALPMRYRLRKWGWRWRDGDEVECVGVVRRWWRRYGGLVMVAAIVGLWLFFKNDIFIL